MFKTLMKKQMLEIFKGFFYDAKKGKKRSKKGAILYILLYALLMFGYLGGMFGVLSHALAAPLIDYSLGWLYFLIMGGIALALGVFGSVFSTYSSLYMAKDNDLLLSLPIPIRYILFSRLMGVFLPGVLFSVVALIPMSIMYWLAAPLSFLSIIGPIVFSIDVILLVFILSTALGWVVAKASAKMKNKSIMTTIIALLGVALYYVVYFKMYRVIGDFLQNIQSAKFDTSGAMSIIYTIGMCGCGAVLPMILTTAVIILILVGVYAILSKTFIKIVTTKTGSAKIKYKEKEAHARSLKKALLFREIKHYTSSSTYMLNCSMSSLFMFAGAIFLLVKGQFFSEVINDVFGAVPESISVLIVGLISLMMSINDISAPSVSLEGKAIWIPKTLPISSLQFIRAKMWNHVLFTIPPALLLAIILCFVLKVGFLPGVLILICVTSTCFAQAQFGLFINLKKLNLNWTSEMVIIKQSFGVFIVLLAGFIFSTLKILSGLFLCSAIGAMPILVFWTAFSTAAAILLNRWLCKRGTKIVEEL